MSDHSKGIFFAAISAFLYGLVPVLGKIAVSAFPPIFVAFVVTLLSSLYLALTVMIMRSAILREINKEALFWIIIIGFFSALGSLLGFSGFLFGKASEAGFLFQFEIFFVAFLAYLFLGEKLYKGQLIGLAFMLIGAALFSQFNFRSSGVGGALFVAAGFAWGISDIFARAKISKKVRPIYAALGRSIFSSLFLLPGVILFTKELPDITINDVYYFLLYGAIVSGIFIFLYTSLKYVKAVTAISLYILSPIIAALGGFVVLGEHLSFQQIIGGGIILIGIMLVLNNYLAFRDAQEH